MERGDHTTSARRHPCARPEPGAVGATLHPHARRPRCRCDQDRTAGGRPDPLRHAATQRPVELLRAAERGQAQHQPRPVVACAGWRSSSSSREHADVLVAELPPRRDGPARRSVPTSCCAAQPAADLRLDLRIRADRAVGAAAGVRAGGRSRGRDHRVAGRRPRWAAEQGSAQPCRRVHRDRDGHRDPRRAVPARAHRARVRRSTCRWPRRCSTSTSICTTRCGRATTIRNWIRSFRPGDYLVLTVANGESLVVSGHPAERGTFDLFLAAMGRPTSSTIRGSATSPTGWPTSTHSPTSSATSPPACADADTFEEIFSDHQLAVGQVRQPGELTDDRVGDRARGGGRHRRPRRRFVPGAERPVALQRRARRRGGRRAEVPRRGQPHAARRYARLRRRQRSTTSRSSGVLSSRVPTPTRHAVMMS